MKRFSTLCRLHGAGYKTLGRLNHTLSNRFQRLKAVWTKPKVPFELWLGRLSPLNPYLRGHLIRMLRQAYKPKDLIVPPESVYQPEFMAMFS